MKVIKTLLVISFLFFLGCASSKDFVRPGTNFNKYQRIAVLPLVDFPNHPQSGVQVADIISMRLLTTGATILDRSQTSQLLSEQKLGVSGLVDERTAPNIGSVLGVQALIAGSVNEWRSACNNVQFIAGAAPAILCTSVVGITLKLIDVETGQIVWSGSARGSSVGTDSHAQAAEKAVEKIVEQLNLRLQSHVMKSEKYIPAEKLLNKTKQQPPTASDVRTCEDQCASMYKRRELKVTIEECFQTLCK
jgi:TolB-like protein